MRSFTRLIFVLLVAVTPMFAAEEFDDCDANFIAFIGSDAYRFSPSHDGELGTVRLYGHLSYQRAAHSGRSGSVPWRLTIERVEDGQAVLTVRGRGAIESAGSTLAEYWWDGRDDSGAIVPSGRYRYTFNARYVEKVPGSRIQEIDYELAIVQPMDEAIAGADEVFVDNELTRAEATKLRISANVSTSCQRQQNVPLEAGFGYNFFYGSTHAHSNWSDGGQPTTACSSGNAYGSGTMTPSDVLTFARDTAGLDFWVVNEHNHLIQDAIATNFAPVTEAKVRQRYQDGLAAANAATTSAFVGIYGMEWGVSTNTDQGHLTLLETPKLLGWETCTTCNGPGIECTPGTNCYFDIFTPKRFGYLTLYARSVENPSSAGALGIFNHPASGNFDNFAFDANADNAMQGIAVRSGLAFSTATDCATANIGSTDYSVRWREALAKGFHLAPVADHDSHCNNYGVALPTRTVYLLPNAIAPVLTKQNLLAAHKARRFYTAEDPNLQLVFKTSDGAHVMGEIFEAPGGATMVGTVYDPDGEGVTTIEIWRGQIGAAAPTAAYRIASGASTISLTEALTSGSYWYYIHAIQADGHDAWSAPMWITYKPASGNDTTAPTTSITAPAAGATVSGVTAVTASASDNVGVTKVEFFLDGVLQSTDTAAPYSWSWNTAAGANGAYSLSSKAYDAAANVGSSSSVGVTVNNDTTAPATSITSPAAGATVSGVRLVTASASDNVGVSRVEFLLNGALQSTDTTAPYEWSWNTQTAANGSQSLSSRAFDSAGNSGVSATVAVTVANDVTVPTTSITSPAAGATVVGSVTVTASATDDVGVTKVEFLLDGVLKSTDTTAPYEWLFDSTTTTNGTHNLSSKAYDTSSNIGTSANVSITVSNPVATGTAIGGFSITQANATLTYTIPAGTTIPTGGYVIVARNSSKAAFETFWNVTLGTNVVFINAADAMPQINGSETYSLKNVAGTRIDGITIAMAASGGESIRRTNGCGNANKASSWTRGTSASGNPGSGAPAPCAKGVYISEFSDADGTGNFGYEFIELHNDK